MPPDLLQRLLAAGPPLATDAWSLRDDTLRAVLTAVEAGARTVVECGSGRSTVIVARLFAELGEGSLRSLEHDDAWAERTRALLAVEELARAEVITAPLEPHPLAGPGGWYAASAVGMLPPKIDLLLVDGPPAGEPELHRSRHPALPELAERLTPGAAIVLDDAGRPGEAKAIELWSDRFGLEFDVATRSGFATAQWPLYVGATF